MIDSRLHLSPLSKAMQVAASSIHAQSQRMLVISQNLAHAGVQTNTKEIPYQRRVVAFKSVYDPTMQANLLRIQQIGMDKTPPRRVYDPGNPVADEQGYILESNINAAIELNDMREASRSHESSVRALEKALGMLQSMTTLLKSGG
jgi:flagellar basal-body rod protein FlgC